jgi:hypothetical protein
VGIQLVCQIGILRLFQRHHQPAAKYIDQLVAVETILYVVCLPDGYLVMASHTGQKSDLWKSKMDADEAVGKQLAPKPVGTASSLLE